MTLLAPFQQATVKAAVERLGGAGVRRFLVADEVGLGKTVVARSVAEHLKRKGRTTNVLYLCPSLEIAGQNRTKLISLTGIDEKDYRSGEDRLVLVPSAPPEEGNGFRIYTFTPGTSLPGWKPGPRTGRKAERAVIRAVLDRYPRLEAEALRLDRGRDHRLLDQCAPDIGGYITAGIDRALRDVFAVPHGSVDDGMLAWLSRQGGDLAEFVSRFRAALALAALRSPLVRPDLVILDEFHRYADLILPGPNDRRSGRARERSDVHRLLVDALLNGDHRPAVLLLSATPYRLRRLNGEEVHVVEHYRALIDLAGFVANDEGVRGEAEAAMRAYHDTLAASGPSDEVRRAVLAAKRRVEVALAPLMARTERALVHESDLFERLSVSVDVQAPDLELFRHFARAVRQGAPAMAGWTPAMWTSIPHPAQTLHGYKVWDALVAAPRPRIEASSARSRVAHPQLRRLAEMTGGPDHLGLPWQPPTIAWWRLEGPWSPKRPTFGKILLFSRWRAAPTAISSLLSLQLTGGLRQPGAKAQPPLLRPGGRESGALVGLFAPWPSLSHAVEPLKSPVASIRKVRARARDDLERYLADAGVRLDSKEKRPTWLVACGLERKLSAQAFRRLCNVVTDAGKGRRWDGIQPIASISPAELRDLANHLLSAPGAIVARSLRRHGIAMNDAKAAHAVFGFAWNHLRGYLGHRPFAAVIRSGTRSRRYPEALCEATLKGGFEAVLDEQIGILGALGDAKGLQIVEQLSACLVNRPSLVRLRSSGKDHRIAVQAVAPFAGGEQRRRGKGKGGTLRSDTLRRAFNSPFWPHVLCTTSVGQEGLDFHLWCRRLVHWDLPSDPVDFEQREGRIARYASLAVRASLAEKYGDEALRRAEAGSPFLELLEAARRAPPGRTGLERWWLPERGHPISISFDWKFSLKSARKEKMLKDLLYYRLALGQPDPNAFAAMLTRIGASEVEARSLAIDLSAISRVPLLASANSLSCSTLRGWRTGPDPANWSDLNATF